MRLHGRARSGDPVSNFDGDRDGVTYDHQADYLRLNAQHRRVYHAMKNGAWWTLADLAKVTDDPEASISARLRDFRKKKFGSWIVDRRRWQGCGMFEYRLTHA